VIGRRVGGFDTILSNQCGDILIAGVRKTVGATIGVKVRDNLATGGFQLLRALRRLTISVKVGLVTIYLEDNTHVRSIYHHSNSEVIDKAVGNLRPFL